MLNDQVGILTLILVILGIITLWLIYRSNKESKNKEEFFLNRDFWRRILFFFKRRWVARENKGAPRWMDRRDIPLGGKMLSELSFAVESKDPYYRAGFKLMSPNSLDNDIVTDNEYLVFHLAADIEHRDIKYIVYKNRNIVKNLTLLQGIHKNRKIQVSVEINGKNFILITVEGRVVFSDKINPELRKVIYLAAWGDDHEFEVVFKKIKVKKI